MQTYITPNDEGVMGATDSISIQNAVKKAKETGIDRVLIPRVNARTGLSKWDIDRAVILESELEIVLDNCYIRQCDGCFDNVFRSHEVPEDAQKKDAQKHGIRIVGRGHAVIDGGTHNGLTELTSLKEVKHHITRNNLILIMHTKDFVIENISLENQRWWAVNLLCCEYGRISNVHIHSECEQPNIDGIDLRDGCHDIIIENITGQAGDDLIALSAIGTSLFADNDVGRIRFTVDGKCPDIHDITIKNVIGTSVNCTLIAIRYCDGKKVYNVTIDNVHDVDNGAVEAGKHYPEYPKNKIGMDIRAVKLDGNSPYCLLRVGQDGFGKRTAIHGEAYNINATNLYSRGGCVIMLNVTLKNSYFGNIYADNDVDYIVTTKSGRTWQNYGAELENIVIENVFYGNESNPDGTAFDFDVNNIEYGMKNVIINRAFLGNCKRIFNMRENGVLTFSGIRGTNVTEGDGTVTK